jgi:mono/diheme cytochrome c family protein
VRPILFILPVLILVAPAPAPQARESSTSAAAFDSIVQPFLSETCYGCHNATKKKGDLNLKEYNSFGSVANDTNTWEKILQKIRTGEMPPEEEPRPSSDQVGAVVQWLDQAIADADERAAPEPGRVTVRRLNRAEYNNTIRDLLGVDIKPADDFPHDDSGYGFDNIGDVLSLSPVLMERYVIAAERIARTALYGPEAQKPTLVRRSAGSRKIEPVHVVPESYDVTGLTFPNALHTTHHFPAEGEYVIKVLVGGSRPAGSEPVQMALWIDGRRLEPVALDPEQAAGFFSYKQDFSGKLVEYRARVSAGEHWLAGAVERMYEGLPAAYNGPNPTRRPPPPKPEFKPRPGIPPERLEERRKRFEEMINEKVPANDVRVAHVEIAGPYDQTTGAAAESFKKVYVCGHRPGAHRPGCARRIVTNLLTRAFRRPARVPEVDKYLRLHRAARAKGDSFAEGIAIALQAMLVSPDFLFRFEGAQPEAAGASLQRISQHELASRLSYFLWASMPDDELRLMADQRMLRKPEILAAQVRRMLQDPKAGSLVQEFGGQWLKFRALESVAPDRDRFPQFEDYLRLSMKRETELFFETIMREDRSILEFVDADYTFLNERLARHYGIDGVTGPEFRRTALADARRGGVLTHGSVLTVSSYATRTSPVLRGKWILENILAAPPPPPLPGVANLDETKVGVGSSVREQLEAHRTNPICASCHRRMDPLGFGLENFDAIGAWRTKDGEFPVDAAGTLPDGRSFSGPAELKSILKSEREAFARALSMKLLTYALGRGLEPYDQRTVRTIARRLPAYDYRFSGLVLEIVNSAPFQMRKASATP